MEEDSLKTVRITQAFIEEHIGEDISEADIAKISGYSVRHSNRLFKEYAKKNYQ